MKRALLLSMLASVSVFLASGQDATSPHTPVIVKKLYLAGQATALGSLDAPIPLFTPSHDGLYQVSMFIQGAGHPSQTCSVSGCTGVSLVYAPGVTGGFNNVFLDNYVYTFIGVSGRQVGYFTAPFGGATLLPYDLAIVIEEF